MRSTPISIKILLIFTSILIIVSCAGSPSMEESGNPVDDQPHEEDAVNDKELLVFKNEAGLELEVSEMDEVAFGFVHKGKVSPDGDVWLITEEIDHGYQKLAFRTYFKTHMVDDISVSPESFSWSPTGKYVVIHNIDYYADAGSIGIVLLNVESGHFIEITSEQISSGIDLGKREKINIYNIVWLDENSFSMVASAGYLGESGHPGIDFNRKTILGDKFGKRDDFLLVASWKVEVVNDQSEKLDPEKPEISETLKLLLGKWQSMDDTSSYVTFTKDEIIYSYDNEIINRESYELSDSCNSSSADTGARSPGSESYIYIRNSDTCFYIIDLQPHHLSLSYVGRGNTLSYVK